MKVKAPFEVREVAVPIESGQDGGYSMLVVPLRFCKTKFIGNVKSVLGNWYKIENGQHVGWSSYFRGIWLWMPSKSVR